MDDDLRRSEVSAEHLAASADALTELARMVSSPKTFKSGNAPLFVDLVHYEHGYFLSPNLRGFSILPSAGGRAPIPEPPFPPDIPDGFAKEVLAGWSEDYEIENLFTDRASALVNPKGSTEQIPFTWATVAGQPVADQVREVLESLTSLLVRQSVSHDFFVDAGNALPGRLQSVGEELARLTTGVLDTVTRSGWRAAARELRLRAENSGRPLRVRYRPTVFDAGTLAERVPLLREVYNRISAVRMAVDRTASGMARAMYISGDGPADLLRTLNDQFEHLGLRQFLAHAVRDSFVCGNGTMIMSDVMSGSFRLIPPEELIAVHGEIATIDSNGRNEDIHPVIHLQGGRQMGSELGISFLEPFVKTCVDRDTFLSVLLTSEIILSSRTANDDNRSWAIAIKPYAQDQLRQISTRTKEILGSATEQFVDPAPGTYFEGQERMSPSAGRLTLVDSLDNVIPYRRA